jgi:hypothetical protein
MQNVVILKIYFETGANLSEALSPPRFCLGWSSNFVGSESDQIQSVKLLQNMLSNRTQHPSPGVGQWSTSPCHGGATGPYQLPIALGWSRVLTSLTLPVELAKGTYQPPFALEVAPGRLVITSFHLLY